MDRSIFRLRDIFIETFLEIFWKFLINFLEKSKSVFSKSMFSFMLYIVERKEGHFVYVNGVIKILNMNRDQG